MRLADFGEDFEPFIGNGYHSLVRFNGAEPVVRRHRLAALGKGVEERAFAHVGQTYDSGTEHVG